jgi:hypothetical protein
MKTKLELKSKIGLVIIWLAIFILGGYYAINIATMPCPDMVELTATAPGKGEPVTATFQLNNPTDEEIAINYSFYVNGKLQQHGYSRIQPHSRTQDQYVKHYKPGEQVNFLVCAESGGEVCERSAGNEW